MERDKKIELLKSLQDRIRPAKEVIEILKGEIIEVDSFMEALKITSQEGNTEGKSLVATGELKQLFEQIKKQKQ